MADQVDRYRLVTGRERREWLLPGPVRGGELRDYREGRGLLDREWAALERQVERLRQEREEFERRAWIVAMWELAGFALVILLGLILMSSGNEMLPPPR